MCGGGVGVWVGGGGVCWFFFFFFNGTATTEIYTLSLHDALPISDGERSRCLEAARATFRLFMDLSAELADCSPQLHVS